MVNNGLARTPQMGWNTWNRFGCDISQDTILGAANGIIKHGLDKLGYKYVLIDDCWHAETRNNRTGAPEEDRKRFPDGIKGLSDKIHAMGLKIGIYSSAGVKTCAGRYGSLGYEKIDAETYAKWEVDYLKYDNCNNEGQAGTPEISRNRYAKMSTALNATGRPILYSMCNWGEDQPWNWAGTIANSWRMSGDIVDEFDRYDDRCPCTDMLDCKLPGYHCSMARIVDFAAPVVQKSGEGGWNDLDMLEVGNGGMTHDEYVTHFSMWALLKSPLILGNDLTNMTPETLEIISNDAVIAVNQGWGGPVSRVFRANVTGGEISLWTAGTNGGSVVAIMNTSPDEQPATVSYERIFPGNKFEQTRAFRIYDLWEKSPSDVSSDTYSSVWGKDLGVWRNNLPPQNIRPHLTKVFKLIPLDGYDGPVHSGRSSSKKNRVVGVSVWRWTVTVFILGLLVI